MLFSRRWLQLVRWLVATVLGGQALTIALLTLNSELRKRRAAPSSFPHGRQGATEVGSTSAEIFTYGQDLYDAMLAAIDAARTSIFLESYIWKSDRLGQRFKERLERKAAQGVQVYVIYDAFANLVVPPSFKRFPPEIHVLEYRTFARVWYALDPRRYARDHRKLLVVDNAVAFLGGFNIGALYATQWRDTHLRLRGPAAADLGLAFIQFWNTNRGARPAIPEHPPGPWDTQILVRRNDPARLVFPIRGMYLDAIERAQSHIYLTNAYFIPDRVILTALCDAARRGIDVRVLVPWDSNHVVADWLARGFFERCLRHGVRIFGYQHAMIHAKTATIDGIWSTIGTANLDRLSLAGNYELNVEIYDRSFAGEMERIFMTDLTNAFEVTREVWERRPWYDRGGQLILSPLRPLA
jgi:cardiolipin synthase